MAHKFESGVFNKEAAWHGLGVVYTDSERLSPEKAIELSGLDWEVEKRPVLYDTSGGIASANGKFVVVRKSDDAALGVVGKSYRTIQNKRGFDYLQQLVDDGEIEIETAISLRGGKIVTILARRPEHIEVAGEDQVEYLAFTNSHDGSGSAKVFFTKVRIVCKNTQDYALSQVKNFYGIRHSGDTEMKLADARKALQLSFKHTEEMQKAANELVSQKINGSMFMNFLDQLVPVPDKDDHPRAYKNAVETRQSIGSIFKYEDNLNNIRATKWGALQAVLQYSTHNKNYRTPERRFESLMSGTDFDNRAFSILQEV